MIERKPEQIPAEMQPKEMSLRLFDAHMHVVEAEQRAADTHTEIARGIREGTLTMANHEDVAAMDGNRYIEQRRAERELKRAERLEQGTSWLGRLTFKK